MNAHRRMEVCGVSKEQLIATRRHYYTCHYTYDHPKVIAIRLTAQANIWFPITQRNVTYAKRVARYAYC
jgi:hypothetical protein